MKKTFKGYDGEDVFFKDFFGAVSRVRGQKIDESTLASATNRGTEELGFKVILNFVRQNPHYTIAALEEGVYIIGMKDQFNVYDLQNHPIKDRVQYIIDDMGFVLFDRTNQRNIDSFGPYCIEQYIRKSSFGTSPMIFVFYTNSQCCLLFLSHGGLVQA